MPSANWYADPSGRYEFRYWDGTSWTEHVASKGTQSVDPLNLPAGGRTVAAVSNPDSEMRRIAEVPWLAGSGLQIQHVRARKQALAYYQVSDSRGRHLALIREPDVLDDSRRLRSRRRPNEGTGSRLQFIDTIGNAFLTMLRPAAESTWSSALYLNDRDGSSIGMIVQESSGMRGAIRDVIDAALPVAVAPTGLLGSSVVSRTARSSIGGMKGKVAGDLATVGAFATMGALGSVPKGRYATLRVEADGEALGSISATSPSSELWELRDASGRPLGQIKLSDVSLSRLKAPSKTCRLEFVSAIDARLHSLAIAAAVGLLADVVARG